MSSKRSFSKTQHPSGLKDETRTRLSELILEELAEKIKRSESLRSKLEAFTDLPVEKVADAVLNQFEYVLSSELRDLIIYLIEQESAPPADQPASKEPEAVAPPPSTVQEAPSPPGESIMQHFAVKESIASAEIDFPLAEDDWLYLYGFSYAPDSSGKGVPARKLLLSGIDNLNNIFLLDYGDVRFYVSKLSTADYAVDKVGKLILSHAQTSHYKLEHERILNMLRADNVLMPLPFWTILQGRERVINRIEDRYVELLRVLIDLHDALDWDVEIYANDQHLIQLPSMAGEGRDRIPPRDLKHPVPKGGKDVKLLEKLMTREKGIAQDIHSSLLLHASKSKVDYMVRLDNAFMEDWKSILAARYTVGKEKRKLFWQEVQAIQKQYEEYELMIKIGNPNARLTFS